MTQRLLFVSIAAMLGATRALPGQCAVRPSMPINSWDCAATPSQKVDQTSAIQGAINASCAFATNNGSPPPVYIPAGEYLIVNLEIRCSGLVFYGVGSGGLGGGLGGTRLC